MLSGQRVPLPRPISEKHVSMAPEELRRGRAGRRADKADFIPSGEGLALGADYHRRSLYRGIRGRKTVDDSGACHRYMMSFITWFSYRRPNNSKPLLVWARMQLPTERSDIMTGGSQQVTCFVFVWLFLKCITNIWGHAHNRSHKFQHASILADVKHVLTRKWLNPTGEGLGQ